MYVLLEGAWAPNCKHCKDAKNLLDSYGYNYTCIVVSEEHRSRFEAIIISSSVGIVYSGSTRKITVPQIFDITDTKEFTSFEDFEAYVNDENNNLEIDYIGGYSELKALIACDDIED